MTRSEVKALEPPAHLSTRSADLWRAVVPGRARSPGRLALLQAGLEALDRSDECRRILEDEGLVSTTKTTGATHVHPLARLERESRASFMTAWGQLHLEWDGQIDGRPHGDE